MIYIYIYMIYIYIIVEPDMANSIHCTLYTFRYIK